LEKSQSGSKKSSVQNTNRVPRNTDNPQETILTQSVVDNYPVTKSNISEKWSKSKPNTAEKSIFRKSGISTNTKPEGESNDSSKYVWEGESEDSSKDKMSRPPTDCKHSILT